MSLSYTEGSKVDLDAIVAGGAAFMARIKQLKQATAEHQAALDNLKIGTDAVAALQEAQKREQTALEMIADAKAEADEIVKKASTDAAKVAQQLTADAEAALLKANEQSAALATEVKAGREVLAAWAEKTKSAANDLMTKASAMKAAADKQASANAEAAAELAKTQADARASLEAANKLQAQLTARLDAIKAAASQG